MLSGSALMLAAALLLAPDQQGFEQAVDPAVPLTQGAGPSAAQKPEQSGPEQVKPEERRQSKRAPRPTRREPASSGQRSFELGRQPRDGGPARQDVTFTANVLGGYDDNLTAGLGSGSVTSPDAMVSGATASLDGTLSYFRGNSRRAISLDATGSLVGYPNNLDDPALGGRLNAGVRTPLVRALTLELTERVSYEPLFNVLSTGAGAPPPPPGVVQPTPTTGLFERKSWNTNSGMSLEQRWGRRDTSTVGYAYRTQEFTDDNYGDSTGHEATASHHRVLSSQARAGADYRYRNSEYSDSAGSVRPTRGHRIEAVAEFIGAPSRRRSYSVLLAAGAGSLESVNSSGERYSDWLPVGRAGLSFDVSPSWTLEGSYRRDLSLLQGVTDEVYTTDTASAAASGMITRRLALNFGTTYSRWVTPVASGVNESMDVYGASLGLRFLLTGSIAATAGYFYYYHRYSDPASLPEGFPAEYDRQAVRVGVTFFLPLAGTPSSLLNRW